jgi:hypothetical protein
VVVTEECESVQIILTSEEMRIGDIINKPVDYWYEVELNPDTPYTVTILGYTKEKGPKILSLTPEGGDNIVSGETVIRPDGSYLTKESDPTVPEHVKGISQEDIDNWNNPNVFGGDYNSLTNQPLINGVELTGNKSFEEIGISEVTTAELDEIFKDL